MVVIRCANEQLRLTVESSGMYNESYPERHLPWTQDKFAAELRCITTLFPNRHTNAKRVAHDHGETTDGAMPAVVAFLAVRAGVVGTERHPQRCMQPEGRIGEHRDGRAEDVCKMTNVSSAMQQLGGRHVRRYDLIIPCEPLPMRMKSIPARFKASMSTFREMEYM